MLCSFLAVWLEMRFARLIDGSRHQAPVFVGVKSAMAVDGGAAQSGILWAERVIPGQPKGGMEMAVTTGPGACAIEPPCQGHVPCQGLAMRWEAPSKAQIAAWLEFLEVFRTLGGLSG